MRSYFVVTEMHRWGQSSTSITEVMRNANLRQPTREDWLEEAVDNAMLFGEEIGAELRRMEREYRESKFDSKHDAPVRFNLVFMDSNDWEFSGASEFDGSPRYKWVGEGEPEERKAPTKLVKLLFHPDGSVTPAEE